MKKRMITSVLALSLVLASASNVFACTATYVGKKVSENGSTIMARTEDISSAHPKSFVVYPAQDHDAGSMYESAITNFKIENPSHTYKYYAVPDSDGDNDDGTYDEAGYNENGVAVSTTVSADVNEKINAIDPLVEDGLREADMGTIVLSRAKNARDGINIVANIVEKYGSAEGNTLMIGDTNEVWYMEILSGHQYAAIKLPDDVVAIMPNTFLLDYIDLKDTKNVIASKDLIKMPKDNGLLKVDQDGKFSLRKTYGVERESYDQDRLWGGRHFLAPKQNFSYDTDFSMFFKPDEKVSVKDVMQLQKYRYEDTDLNANLEKNNTKERTVRPIGTNKSAECHIFELKDNFPGDAPGLFWMCLGNSEHNVYLPYFPLMDKVNEEYSAKSHSFTQDQAYWVFRGQATLAQLNREKYGKNVAKYWDEYQDEIIKNQEEKNKQFVFLYTQDKKRATNYANEEAAKLQSESLEKAKKMYNELFTYLAGEEGKPHKEAFMPSEMKAKLESDKNK
ncbi:MAG: C69 family dipeptidase [Peptoniphilaceae bacterium]